MCHALRAVCNTRAHTHAHVRTSKRALCVIAAGRRRDGGGGEVCAGTKFLTAIDRSSARAAVSLDARKSTGEGERLIASDLAIGSRVARYEEPRRRQPSGYAYLSAKFISNANQRAWEKGRGEDFANGTTAPGPEVILDGPAAAAFDR